MQARGGIGPSWPSYLPRFLVKHAYVLQNPPLDDAGSEQDPTALRLGMGGIGLGVLVIFAFFGKGTGIDPPEDVTELGDDGQESPAVAFEMYNRYYHRDALKRITFIRV